MRQSPENWDALFRKPHKTQLRADIADDPYYGFDGESGIFSCSTHKTLFDSFGVGNCCAGQLDMVLCRPGEIPKMAKIELYVRLTDGDTVTDWVRRGVYYIDTREWDASGEFLTITAYDRIMMLEQPYFTAGAVITGWPKTDAAVVTEIRSRIGVALDTRTVLDKGYMIDLPAVSSDGSDSDSLRDVLGWIGAMYAGNWIITDEGKLRLVSLAQDPETSYLIDEYGYAITFGGDRILV